MSTNPFFYTVLPLDAPFCGRGQELEALCNHARSNTNVVLYSPRRFGKTSLIKRVQDVLAREKFITLYIDISGTASAEDVAELIAREIFRFVQQKSPLLKKAMSIINNWRPNFTPQPDGSVSVSVQPSSQKTGIAFLEETLDGLDQFLNGNPQQTNIVLDEFQEITGLRNGDKIEALLRKHIQHHSNCSWFFLGSQRRMLLDMFEEKNRPFYQSAVKMQLPPLPEEEAIRFVIEQFKSGGKECPLAITHQIIRLTHAWPFYVQRLSGEIFDSTRNKDIGENELQGGLHKMMEQEGRYYASIESQLAAGQKKLLRALAKEPTESPYAVDYQRKHRLGSLSTIQAGMKKLKALDHIEQGENRVNHLTDPLFALWIIDQEQEVLPEKPASIEKGKPLSFGQTLLEFNVEQSLEKGIAEMPGYRSTEVVEIKASLPEPDPARRDGRPRISIFLSYAHDDQLLKERFFDLIRKRLKTSKEYFFSFSSDNDLLCGTQWHNELQNRIESCDFGLLLVSTSFLASAYIQDHEVPKLKPRCFPVFLKNIDMDGQDLRGLEQLQIYQHDQNKSFEEVRGANQTKFINAFAKQIEARVKEYLEKQKQECVTNGICDDEGARKITEGHLGFKGSLYVYGHHIDNRAKKGVISHKAESESSADTVQARSFIRSWALDSDVPYFALLGDFGTGKTFTCRMLAREINAMHDETPETVPLCIYIDLRRVSTRIGTEKKVPRLTDILRDAIEFTKDPLDRSMVSPEDIIRLVRTNRAMIIFDGLDEKTVHFTPEETNQFIAELWSIREQRDEKENPPPQGKILISCRTHYFRNTIEENTLFLGRDREGRTREDYRSCTLLPFDTAQIREYLEKRLGCDREKIDRIVELFGMVHNLNDLASRPYTLNLITEFIPDIERLASERSQVNTATLYDTTVDNWLARDEGKHEFSTPHKKRLMKSLAAELHRRGGEGLETDELDEWLDEWLTAHPAINEAYRGEKPRETLKKDLRTATFIIREEEESFSFAHTSLQEYFLAGFIVDALSARHFGPRKLEMKMPSKETLDFVADMLAVDERKNDPVNERLTSILETAYHKEVSELAFALWLKLHERRMHTPAPRSVHLEGADLAEWIIGNMNLSAARFDEANLRGASFRKSVLCSASFNHANLVNTEFLGCNATGADFSDADAVAGVWRNCDLRQSRWTTAELRLASFVECLAADTIDFPDKTGYTVARCTGLTNSSFHGKVKFSLYDGHSVRIETTRFNPDGTIVASASIDGTVKLWDVQSGTCIITLTGHTDSVKSAKFSQDSTRIISASDDKTIKLWDIYSGHCISTFSEHDWVVNDCELSPDGTRIVSASADKTIKLWDVQSGKCLLTLSEHSSEVNASIFSPDGSRIVSASSDNTLKLWDTFSGRSILNIAIRSTWFNNCTFNTDGTKILSTSHGSIKIWNANSGTPLITISKHGGVLRDCAVNNSGTRYITGSNDHSAKLWDAKSGRCILTLSEHSDVISSCAFSPDGSQIITASYDNTLKLWDAFSGQRTLTLAGHTSWINDCAFSPDGTRILSVSADQTLRLWDTQTGKCVMILLDNFESAHTCAFSPDGKKILSSSAGYYVRDKISLKLWDIQTGEIIKAISEDSRTISACTFSPDGKSFLTACLDNKIKLWDTESGQCIKVFKEHTGPVWDCVFSHDGKRLLSASSDNTLKIWDVASGFSVLTLSGHSSAIFACKFNPDSSSIISASSDKTLKLWDAHSGQCLITMANLADNETASWSETELKLLWASPEAWRWIGLADGCRRLPIELLDDPVPQS
jgi:WD40 repeat protein/Cdc6-like AAA superfamily ATPase